LQRRGQDLLPNSNRHCCRAGDITSNLIGRGGSRAGAVLAADFKATLTLPNAPERMIKAEFLTMAAPSVARSVRNLSS
jgi:hypothetical protein